MEDLPSHHYSSQRHDSSSANPYWASTVLNSRYRVELVAILQAPRNRFNIRYAAFNGKGPSLAMVWFRAHGMYVSRWEECQGKKRARKSIESPLIGHSLLLLLFLVFALISVRNQCECMHCQSWMDAIKNNPSHSSWLEETEQERDQMKKTKKKKQHEIALIKLVGSGSILDSSRIPTETTTS